MDIYEINAYYNYFFISTYTLNQSFGNSIDLKCSWNDPGQTL